MLLSEEGLGARQVLLNVLVRAREEVLRIGWVKGAMRATEC